MTGEFSKKCQTNTEKNVREILEKSPTFFGKTPTFFKKSPNVFSGTSEILSQSEKSDFGRRGVKVVKAKSANPREGARVARA